MALHETGRHYNYVEIVEGKRIRKMYHYMQNRGMFKIPESVDKLIVMSDIHSATPEVVGDMIANDIINKDTIVLSMGDMSGNFELGGNGDPINEYRAIRDAARAFYFVQGNHDEQNSSAEALKNDDGTRCCVDRRVQDTPIGKIGGVNGIISRGQKPPRPQLHIYHQDTYLQRLKNVLASKPDILMTHQPVRLSSELYQPKLRLCGHCHASDDRFLKNDFINCDNRILDIRD